ncbi:hypothetical protein ACJRO7_019491 [Eucalyptus globulus]|uniref:Uncharacterized protein n=1 Tax=Eucalyptus globulus TaxID=34317 RepID=A0ABD3KQ97_EUCGL
MATRSTVFAIAVIAMFLVACAASSPPPESAQECMPACIASGESEQACTKACAKAGDRVQLTSFWGWGWGGVDKVKP